MTRAIQAILRRGFDAVERALDRLFGPANNPLGQLGALGYFLFWIIAVSGLYLFALFDTGVQRAFASVEWMTVDQWWHAGIMRSFHRYASDAMVVVALLHLLREFALDRFRGARWFSWFTGAPLVAFLYVCGITGYWLVWDKLAQYVATTSTELLDWLPIFGEPIARNFLDPTSLSDRFFTLLVYLHIAVPLVLLFVMWIHIQRISRPNVNPPRLLGAITLVALLVISIAMPAVSQGAADLARAPSPVRLDSIYLILYPLADRAPGAAWAAMALIGVVLALVPLLPPRRAAKPAKVYLDHCNGCGRCVADCPYEALRLVPRTDGAAYAVEALVDVSKCVACGICVGSCPSSTPFRRTEELVTGIDLPDMPLAWMRDRAIEACKAVGERPRLLAIACAHGAGPRAQAAPGVATLELPCVAMAPPSLIDFALSRKLADGVVIAGCNEGACYNRLGVEWTRQRVAQQRDPYLRTRVPRDRLLMVWASPGEAALLSREIDDFKTRLAGLSESSAEPSAEAPPAASREREAHT